VLDIGCGPGLLAEEIAALVGPNGRVYGIDRSTSMIELSQERVADQPHAAWLEFQVADAGRLPFPSAAFDAAVCTQVYEYVVELDAALAELRRVLAPGGRAVILDTDWDSIVWHSGDPDRMARVLAAWMGHCAHPHLPRTLAPRLRAAGLEVRRVAVIPLLNTSYTADSYSGGMIPVIQRYAARHGVPQDEAEAWAEELRRLGAAGAYFFSLNRYLFLARAPRA
jgi:ubiquinone/menaquinone biosynthesis C-methylase UbiE